MVITHIYAPFQKSNVSNIPMQSKDNFGVKDPVRYKFAVGAYICHSVSALMYT